MYVENIEAMIDCFKFVAVCAVVLIIVRMVCEVCRDVARITGGKKG